MGPEIRTSLVAEIGVEVGAGEGEEDDGGEVGDDRPDLDGVDRVDRVARQAQAVTERAGGVDVAVESGGAPNGRTLSALFPNVGDSTRAAVELVRTLPGTVRIALYTGVLDGARPAAMPPVRARHLLEHTAPGQILTTTSTAVMAGGTLPPGTALLDRGSRTLGAGDVAERTYELVVDSPDEAGDDAGASNLEWARRAVDGPALGLDDHLATIEGAWTDAVAGPRRMIHVSGEGGVGKTTLVAELALRLHAQGALVLYGRWDRDVATAYQAFREALGVYADGCSTNQLRADLEGWGHEIARLLPDVGARVRGLQPAVPAPYDERSRLFEAVEAWFRALTRRTPTLLVLEDMQWAEPGSLYLIDHLHQASAGQPLLVVVTLAEDLMSLEMVDALEACAADMAGHSQPGELRKIYLPGR
jgi:hypothetical protein